MTEHEERMKALAAHTWDDPCPVPAVAGEQAGFQILTGNCPRCGYEVTVNGQGKIICKCGLPLAFTAA